MHPLTLTFRFDQLPPEGRAFAGELSIAAVTDAVGGLVGSLGYRVDAPLVVSGTVYPARADVVVDGSFRGELMYDCVRCLTERRLVVEGKATHVLVKRGSKPAVPDEETELDDSALDEPDEFGFDGENVALEEVFREDLLLEVQMNPTCEHAGLGECVMAVAQTEGEKIDPRWAPLAALKAKLQDS